MASDPPRPDRPAKPPGARDGLPPPKPPAAAESKAERAKRLVAEAMAQRAAMDRYAGSGQQDLQAELNAETPREKLRREKREAKEAAQTARAPLAQRVRAAVAALRHKQPLPPFSREERFALLFLPLAAATFLFVAIWISLPHRIGAGPAPPDEVAARAALQRALDAWRAGSTPEALKAESPSLVVSDYQWRAGARLAGYSILGDEPYGGDRRLRVELAFDAGQSKQAKKVVRYLVATRRPVTVVREEE